MAEAAVSSDTGAWLVEHRSEMDRGEAVWLQRLAEFDLAQGWAADGHLTCAHWLMWHTKLARATAYEKLGVAHELRRRPVIAEAFSAGRLSYSAVRTITRIQGPDRDVDVALVNLAEAGTVADLERAVRFYQLHSDQHRRPTDTTPEPSLRRRPNLDGTTTIEVTLEDSEAEELWRAIAAFIERPFENVDDTEAKEVAVQPSDCVGAAVDESARADRSAEKGPDAGDGMRDAGQPVDEPSGADAGAREVGEGLVPTTVRRAAALVDMARVALAHAGDGGLAGQDRYMIHVVVREGQAELLDGTPLPPAVAGRLACDCSSVVHLLDGHREVLALGRKTKQWSTAQRRAIMVRDGGRCRFPGCDYRVADVHHHRWWTRGGNTDVSNGWLACPRHHTLVHDGLFVVSGEPNGVLTFSRPGGAVIGRTKPVWPVFGLAA